MKLLEYLEGGTIIRNSLFYKFALRASSEKLYLELESKLYNYILKILGSSVVHLKYKIKQF